jgi:hypothetical protein
VIEPLPQRRCGGEVGGEPVGAVGVGADHTAIVGGDELRQQRIGVDEVGVDDVLREEGLRQAHRCEQEGAEVGSHQGALEQCVDEIRLPARRQAGRCERCHLALEHFRQR